MRDLDEALELLHFGFRRVVQEPDALLARRGLGRVHHRILYFVRKRGPVTHAALGEVLAVTKQALHGPLRQLIDRGLVVVRANPDDGRQKLLTLTARGRALEAQISGIQRELFSKAFRAVGARSEQGFCDVMRALV